MDATTMPSTRSLLANLRRDFPDITFAEGSPFRWSPEQRTVYYADSRDGASLLHEVAHAQLAHTHYTRDIELLQMERDAWEYTARLTKQYNVAIDPDHIETMLDSYRDWLHARSICPSCQATGVQTDIKHYHCLACLATWKVNEARSCALRRYKVQHTKTAA